ncbi:hypothetical protein SDC9_53563 [bioreactor metagenome]|uniref:Uncharacterized protein n=1 Tax=bioreactor metagenome TaxID=1076179 RepID=A0A644WU98_9ZZZZ
MLSIDRRGTDHQVLDFRNTCLADLLDVDYHTVAQYGYDVANLHDLIKLVTDENDRYTLCLQHPNNLEKIIYLFSGESCRRFIEY